MSAGPATAGSPRGTEPATAGGPRPDASGAGSRSGGTPARRAVARWAWRLFRREWRQQFLVLLLLTLAVAATVVGAAVGENSPPPPGAGFGDADHAAVVSGAVSDRSGAIAAVRQTFGTVDVIENQTIGTGTVHGATLRAQDPNGAYGRPMLALDSGRYPSGADEVALATTLAKTLNLSIGQDWTYAGQARRVVGLVENPQNLLEDFALVPPGRVARPTQVVVLFRASDAAVAAAKLPGGVSVQTRGGSPAMDPAFVVLVFGVFGLVFVGLVAVAGFSVLVQRRMRGLGVLASLGATERNVRLVMIVNGAVIGGVAAVLGTVLGLVGWLAYVPLLEASAHHRISRTAVPWWLVGVVLVLAVVTSVLAARRPAKVAARIPVVAALSGRQPAPKPVHRSVLRGVIVLAAGLIMVSFSGGWGAPGGRNELLQLGGLLATCAGLLMVTPSCVALLGGLAGRVPVASRLALRDLARYRARSGAALAAISFAVFIAMTISLLATGRYADPVDYAGPNLRADQLMVYPPGHGPGSDPAADTTAPGPATMSATAGAIAATLGSTDVLALDASDAFLGQLDTSGGDDALRGDPGTLYIATPEVLRHFGIDPARVDPSALLLTSRRGLDQAPGLQVQSRAAIEHGCTNGSCAKDPRIQRFDQLPTGASAPNLLVTPYAVRTLQLQTSPGAWLVTTGTALTDAQINSARQTAAAAGLTIETKSSIPSMTEVRDDATVAGILLALAVLAMTIGLIRGEAAADLRTLTATGAAERTRRVITAATGCALALLGAAVGTVVAYLLTVALFHSQLSMKMSEPPMLDLLLVLVGLPVVATVGCFLLAGREPGSLSGRMVS